MSKDYPSSIVALVHQGSPQLSANQYKIISDFLMKNEGKFIRVTYAKQDKGRSDNQNRYYWGVVIAEIAGETGHTPEEVHEYMKSMFLPRHFIRIGTSGKEQQLTKSTTTLSTTEFEDFMERIRAFAATELQLTIPLPNEA